MSLAILLIQKPNYTIYSLKGKKEKDSENLSIIQIKTLDFLEEDLNQDNLDLNSICEIENPSQEEIQEIYNLFNQLVQIKVLEGYKALNIREILRRENE